ncbi:Formyltetrahydrofolate deformylase [Piscirickettsia salmonis]|uniref:Formyltetrahydrofolate deformylase n=1 Tax=Piscirickettsia salmonis TaxID=1238 RepID=A0A1L6TG56_PISSA|nr:formyltetrahydrofolate deformylase [Piscirickettsia salmonis]AKP74712.1 formyltetrahydrofolate deformylase [Piscirickettsia salmonis LF-89 = ATCC VR-1361]ALB21363.1 formyltetrahydrofolate deformylase [Piscirickettsia salmonis]ALY01602.1 formyltetrahydrofolate deformylase [Piscirickettsia salmonis]AMA41114.1 formyltetrahydrofolate deformylase [Piscirickettsia salmonis]AOS36304.1 formyltetrahydrofolate deformylase [Piscirickettsia salmonis]
MKVTNNRLTNANTAIRLTIACPDRVGLVATIGQLIANYQGNIIEANHHTDRAAGWFFMRHDICFSSQFTALDQFTSELNHISHALQLNWQLIQPTQPKRVILMVSRQSHCLEDILYRWRSKEINIEIPCIISNHQDLAESAKWHNIPYYHLPIPKNNKPAAFKELATIINQHTSDLIVLARYMQILPAFLCQQYPGRIINIHHSFLPAFGGAKPYHQAFERGVKLIGATCHYVNDQLDAGPIIEQDIARVNHCHSVFDMVRLGRDVEKNVLARGLRLHLEDRVFIHNDKTIVFN